MKAKLNALSGLLVVVFYLILSIAVTLIVTIFFGGGDSAAPGRNIDDVIDKSMIANLIVVVILLFIALVVFKDSRRDIFFERKRFTGSKLLYIFPLTWLAVSLFALFNAEWSAFSFGDILLVIIATLAIGFNEEIVTRGILLIGLRNSGLSEFVAWLITLVGFSLMHLLNLIGGGSIAVLFIVATGGTLLYASRRLFNNLFVPIIFHALYDTAFFLLSGNYLAGQDLPDKVLDLQFASFLVLLLASVLFLIFGRGLFKKETTGWS